MGSVNETREGWKEHYELLWEDTSMEGVTWVEDEFNYLWEQGFTLPSVIIEEVKRIYQRVEISIEECAPRELPAAAMAEAPIYRGGEQLQPWQRAFVGMFMHHRETYGHVRLLLADEVGKTLSLAASALVASLLGDGAVLILCPATLTQQWQVELYDRLGVPSAVWLSQKKSWQDHRGHIIKTRGAEDVVRCPYRIGIVSTGLIFQMTLGAVRAGAVTQRHSGSIVRVVVIFPRRLHLIRRPRLKMPSACRFTPASAILDLMRRHIQTVAIDVSLGRKAKPPR